MTSCDSCGRKTRSSPLCHPCNRALRTGLRRVREHELIVAQGSEEWWVWDRHGTLLVGEEPSELRAVVALGQLEQLAPSGEGNLIDSVVASADNYCRAEQRLRAAGSLKDLRDLRAAKRRAKRHLYRVWNLWRAAER
jgi:hypothetical protein